MSLILKSWMGSIGSGQNWETYWGIRYPFNLVVTKLSPSSVRLNWENEGSGWEGVCIERGDINNYFEEIDRISFDSTYYVDNHSFVAGTFFYRIRYFRGSYYSDYSGIDVVIIYGNELDFYLLPLETSLSSEQVTKLQTLITELKVATGSDSLSEAFDSIYLWHNETQEASPRNLAKDAHHGIEVNAPVWTQSQGYQGASGKYIDLNYNPATQGVAFQRDSCSLGYYSWTNNTDDRSNGTITAGGGKCHVSGRNGSNQFWAALNTNGYANLGTNYIGNGMFIATRTGSNLIRGFRNNVYFGQSTDASIDIINQGHYGLAQRMGVTIYYSGIQQGILFYGRGLTDAESIAIGQAFVKYLTT